MRQKTQLGGTRHCHPRRRCAYPQHAGGARQLKRLHRIMHRHALGRRDQQLDAGGHRILNRVEQLHRADQRHTSHRTGLAHRLDGVDEHRHAINLFDLRLGRDTADDVGAVFTHDAAVLTAGTAGDTGDDYFGAAINPRKHHATSRRRRTSATASSKSV